MKDKSKVLFYLYQRAVWYFNIAVGEVRKPLQLWNETALISLLLATIGVKLHLWWIIIIYISGFVVLTIFGKILVYFGVVAYNTALGNTQNPELIEIQNLLKKIDKKIDLWYNEKQ